MKPSADLLDVCRPPLRDPFKERRAAVIQDFVDAGRVTVVPMVCVPCAPSWVPEWHPSHAAMLIRVEEQY